ncbi:MAG: hypothetical protein IKT01_01765, partial [Eubacteriaceae bacterium]|nr:hypothetical protein [Eubacteriaceae bacterium]
VIVAQEGAFRKHMFDFLPYTCQKEQRKQNSGNDYQAPRLIACLQQIPGAIHLTAYGSGSILAEA